MSKLPCFVTSRVSFVSTIAQTLQGRHVCFWCIAYHLKSVIWTWILMNAIALLEC